MGIKFNFYDVLVIFYEFAKLFLITVLFLLIKITYCYLFYFYLPTSILISNNDNAFLIHIFEITLLYYLISYTTFKEIKPKIRLY